MSDVKWFGDTAFVGPMTVSVHGPGAASEGWGWSINVTGGKGYVCGETEETAELARSKSVECALAAVESFKMATGEESPVARRERIATSLLAGLMANTNICDSEKEVVDECLDFTDMLVATLDAPKESK